MIALQTNSQGKRTKTDYLALSGQDSQQATWKWKPWMLLLFRSQRTPSLWEGHCFGLSYNKSKKPCKNCNSLRTVLRACWPRSFLVEAAAESKKARVWILWWAGGYQLMKTSAAWCLICHRGSVSVVIWVMVAFLFFFFPHFLFLVCSHEIFNLDPWSKIKSSG